MEGAFNKSDLGKTVPRDLQNIIFCYVYQLQRSSLYHDGEFFIQIEWLRNRRRSLKNKISERIWQCPHVVSSSLAPQISRNFIRKTLHFTRTFRNYFIWHNILARHTDDFLSFVQDYDFSSMYKKMFPSDCGVVPMADDIILAYTQDSYGIHVQLWRIKAERSSADIRTRHIKDLELLRSKFLTCETDYDVHEKTPELYGYWRKDMQQWINEYSFV
jgi:hypothetical protein